MKMFLVAMKAIQHGADPLHEFDPENCKDCKSFAKYLFDEWEALDERQLKAHGLA